MLQATERRAFDARFAALWEIEPSSIISKNNRHAASIKDVGIGGCIRLSSETFTVQSISTYTETKDDYSPKKKPYKVTELVLFSLKTGQTRYIEWVQDDELEVSFTERKLSKRDVGQSLTYDDGEVIDIDDGIDEIASKEWEIVYKGKTYDYDDDWACKFVSSDGRKSFAYMYEFGDESVGWLTVEAWSETGKEGDGGWEYEVFLSEDIPASALEIISLGKK